MIEWVIIGILLTVLSIVLFLYFRQEARTERRAREIFEAWQTSEQEHLAAWKSGELVRLSEERAKILFDGWKAQEEAEIRSDAIRRSQSVTKGKVTEHLIPYFPEFPYDPRDARFLGSPVDLVVFDGLSEDGPREIVFVEIKTGKHTGLSRRERQVRDCIEAKRVGYALIHHQPCTGDDLVQDP